MEIVVPHQLWSIALLLPIFALTLLFALVCKKLLHGSIEHYAELTAPKSIDLSDLIDSVIERGRSANQKLLAWSFCAAVACMLPSTLLALTIKPGLWIASLAVFTVSFVGFYMWSWGLYAKVDAAHIEQLQAQPSPIEP